MTETQRHAVLHAADLLQISAPTIAKNLRDIEQASHATPADQEPVVWQDGVGMLWDVYSHGKLSKKVVSPIGWDAWSVYRHMVDVGKFSPNIDVRLADTRATPAEHSDDRAVDEFARLMKQKMAASRAKGRRGWDDPNVCSVETLSAMLHEHVAKGDPVDVANFCMMLRHYDAKITSADQSKLQVWYGSMPESNGKTNWTAILHRGDVSEGITLDRSEHPDRVRYKADRVRYLIGEIDKQPCVLDYDADKHSGYVAPAEDRDPVGTPEGWKLVPTEPTETMVVDGFESWPAQFFSSPEEWEAFEAMSGCQKAAHKARLCYRAMLASAPQAPQKDAESVRDAIVEMAAEIATVKRFTKFNMKGERAGTKCTLNVSYELLEQLDAALKSVQPELRS